MKPLPVIVGLGGMNPAGRVSFHHAYRRLVLEGLSQADSDTTYQSLAALMQLGQPSDTESTRAYIRDHTLIRPIELFDPSAVHIQKAAKLQSNEAGQPLEFLGHASF